MPIRSDFAAIFKRPADLRVADCAGILAKSRAQANYTADAGGAPPAAGSRPSKAAFLRLVCGVMAALMSLWYKSFFLVNIMGIAGKWEYGRELGRERKLGEEFRCQIKHLVV
jgi:hypothetical protein